MQAMSSSKFQPAEELHHSKKTIRRIDSSREFVCGCGKSYLSYPALYTHIKNKHNGSQQQGTQRAIFIPNNRTNDEMKIDQQFAKKAEQYVTTQSMLILAEIGEGGQGLVQKDKRVLKALVGKQIWDFYCALCENAPPSLSLNRNSSLDLVIVVYLLGVGQHISYSLSKHYNVFARLFRNCFFHHAAQLFQLCFKGQIKQLDVEECRMAPIITDFFIRFYVPSQIKDKDEMNLYELITNDFCQWMKLIRLTSVHITMQEKYELKNKNFFDIITTNKGKDLRSNNNQKKRSHKKAIPKDDKKREEEEEDYTPKQKTIKKREKSDLKCEVKQGRRKHKKIEDSQELFYSKNEEKISKKGREKTHELEHKDRKQKRQDEPINEKEGNKYQEGKSEKQDDAYVIKKNFAELGEAEHELRELMNEMERNECLKDLIQE